MKRQLAALLLLCLLPIEAAGQVTLPGSGQESMGPAPQGQSFLDKRLQLSGYLRLRYDVFDNLDLDHGPTPSTGRPLFVVPTTDQGRGPLTSANMRLRLEPTLRVGLGVSIHARVDVLDNLVLGSTPEGLPATPWVPTSSASTRAAPPEDSLRVKRAWGQVVLPFGVLAAGRMGALIDWGTGFFVNAGAGLDNDLGDEGDRIAFTTPLWGHLFSFAFDFGAIGPTSASMGLYPQAFDLDRRDDVRSYALAVARYDTPAVTKRYVRAGRTVINYGLLSSLRTQELDIPAYYLTGDLHRSYTTDDVVTRDLIAFAADLWFGLRRGGLTLDIEAAMLLSRVENASLLPGTELRQALTARQFGGVARGVYRWRRLDFGFELGFASGDSAPGFGVRSPLDQLQSQPGDLDGPQFRVPADRAINNFRFNPEYRVDLILWRRIVGTITDAFYARPSLRYRPTDRIDLWGAAISSFAMEAESAPGGEHALGVEFNLGATYRLDPGFELRAAYGVLLPLSGLDNANLGLSAHFAQTLHLIIAYRL